MHCISVSPIHFHDQDARRVELALARKQLVAFGEWREREADRAARHAAALEHATLCSTAAADAAARVNSLVAASGTGEDSAELNDAAVAAEVASARLREAKDSAHAVASVELPPNVRAPRDAQVICSLPTEDPETAADVLLALVDAYGHQVGSGDDGSTAAADHAALTATIDDGDEGSTTASAAGESADSAVGDAVGSAEITDVVSASSTAEAALPPPPPVDPSRQASTHMVAGALVRLADFGARGGVKVLESLGGEHEACALAVWALVASTDAAARIALARDASMRRPGALDLAPRAAASFVAVLAIQGTNNVALAECGATAAACGALRVCLDVASVEGSCARCIACARACLDAIAMLSLGGANRAALRASPCDVGALLAEAHRALRSLERRARKAKLPPDEALEGARLGWARAFAELAGGVGGVRPPRGDSELDELLALDSFDPLFGASAAAADAKRSGRASRGSRASRGAPLALDDRWSGTGRAADADADSADNARAARSSKRGPYTVNTGHHVIAARRKRAARAAAALARGGSGSSRPGSPPLSVRLGSRLCTPIGNWGRLGTPLPPPPGDGVSAVGGATADWDGSASTSRVASPVLAALDPSIGAASSHTALTAALAKGCGGGKKRVDDEVGSPEIWHRPRTADRRSAGSRPRSSDSGTGSGAGSSVADAEEMG